MEKKNNGLTVFLVTIIIVLITFMVLYMTGIISFNKQNSKENNTNVENSESNSVDITPVEETLYNSYNIGDKVTVKLNDQNESTFYVLKNSSKSDEFVTLFAEKNIGTSAFNNDFTDGNEYKGSLIESKLNELTSSWTNVKEKRLITIDEINGTGLTTKKQCGPSEKDLCDSIRENSWLKYNDEIYWTMTKIENNDSFKYDEGKYVYYIDLDGIITGHIVGYTPGGEWNKDGNVFINFGIRPVIEISKKYIK